MRADTSKFTAPEWSRNTRYHGLTQAKRSEDFLRGNYAKGHGRSLALAFSESAYGETFMFGRP
jgi:hypothetical protein